MRAHPFSLSDLRTATVAVLLLAFVALAVGQWASARWLYDASFEATERADGLGRARHAEASLRERVDFLRRSAADNGAWDEAYAYMLRRNGSGPQHPFGSTSYEQLHIGGFGFLGLDGRLADVQQYDPVRGQYVPAGEELRGALARSGVIGAQLGSAAKAGAETGGFARFGGKLYAWGAGPITPTDGHGSPVGSLVLVSELDASFVQQISQTVNCEVALLARPLAAALATAPQHGPLEYADVQFSVADETQLQVRFGMGAVDGANALDVSVRTPRAVHATALRASRYFLWSTLICGTLLAALALWFVERRLLRPVQAASEELVGIGRSGDLSARLAPARHRDQIGTLVDAVNQMLAQLESKQAVEAARERAEAANRAKSDFLATMSHEIRTPLNGVLGMNELLVESALAPQQHDWAAAALASGRHLLQIINDVLDFSKIESGHMVLESIDFDLVQIAEEAMVLFAQPAAKKGLELALELVPAQLQLRVFGDPFRLRQVLVNLIGNAMKFTDRGEVLVRLEVAAASATHASMVLSVTDTGIGIPAEAQAKIFEVFSQADGTTTRRYGGTGLGLSICRRLLGMMGGRISVQSQPGRGACFRIDLRLPKACVDPPPLERPAALAGQRVLVVDDNASSRQILQGQLESWRVGVALAHDAEQALLAMRNAADAGAPFDLVLLDRDMPATDGWELARRIGAQPAIAGPRLILMTSALADGDPTRRQASGIRRFLNKPVRRAELLRALTDTLRSSDADPLAAARAAARSAVPRIGTVLLVEDNPVNQAVAAAMLVRLGVQHVVAVNGREAVERVAERTFALVLMDCQMPVMDGFEATAAIRRLATPGGTRLPIVALTANAIAGDEQNCRDAGMDGFLAKPFTLRQLREELDRWLIPESAAAPAAPDAAMHDAPQVATQPAPQPAPQDAPQEAQPAKIPDGQPAGGAAAPAPTQAKAPRPAQRRRAPAAGSAVAKGDVPAFLASAPWNLDQIEQGLAAGDGAAVCRGARALASGTALVGAGTLSRQYRQLELLGRHNRLEEVRARLAQLRPEHERCLAGLGRKLAEAQ